jgi:PEP-CTERM motif-containing protein
MCPKVLRFVFALVLLCCLSKPAVADGTACPTITVNENGQGTLDFSATGCSGAVFPLTGVLKADPGPSGLASVLTYSLLGPPSLVAGDVLLQDGAGGPILDVVRFNPAGTGNPDYQASLLFYSDNIDGFDSTGDTSAPPGSLYTNTVTIPEVGAEGNNGAVYTPTANEPGFVAGFSVSYNLISDSVAAPEPATYTLLVGGLAGLAFAIRKRRQLT